MNKQKIIGLLNQAWLPPMTALDGSEIVDDGLSNVVNEHKRDKNIIDDEDLSEKNKVIEQKKLNDEDNKKHENDDNIIDSDNELNQYNKLDEELINSNNKVSVILINEDINQIDALNIKEKYNETHTIINIDQNDNIKNIAQKLNENSDEKEIESLFIVSHGKEDSFNLGDTQYNKENAKLLNSLSPYLADEADIMLYGCNTGTNNDFLQLISDSTNADVAGSNDVTGGLGGNNTLENSIGKIETQSLDLSLSESLALANNQKFHENSWVEPNNNSQGGRSVHIYVWVDSSNDEAITWQQAETFGNSLTHNYNGRNLDNFWLADWRTQEEYENGVLGGLSNADFDRFNGAVFGAFDTNGDNIAEWRDNGGELFGQTLSGTPENPNLNPNNYANYDTSDATEGDDGIGSEPLVIIMGGNREGGEEHAPGDEAGQLHDVENGTQGQTHEPDSAVYETIVEINPPSIDVDPIDGSDDEPSNNIPTAQLLEQREDGTLLMGINPFSNTSINIADDTQLTELTFTYDNYNNEYYDTDIDTSNIPQNIIEKFDYTINQNTGEVILTAKNGENPNSSDAEIMAGAIFITFSNDINIDNPDLTTLTGISTLSVRDSLNLDPAITFERTDDYRIFIEDRPDLTEGQTGAIAGADTGDGLTSGHENLENVDNPDYIDIIDDNFNDAHGLAIEGEAKVHPFQNLSLESRDDDLSEFRVIVDNPSELFNENGELKEYINIEFPIESNFTVTTNIVNDPVTGELLGASFEFLPTENSMTANEIEAFIQQTSFQAIGENPEFSRITFSYEYSDVDNNFETSIDGYIGEKPNGNEDFGRTVLYILPINDAPIIVPPPGIQVIPPLPTDNDVDRYGCLVELEEGETSRILTGFTFPDIDSTEHQNITISFIAGDQNAFKFEFPDDVKKILNDNGLIGEINNNSNEVIVKINGVASVEVYNKLFENGLLDVTSLDNGINQDGMYSLEFNLQITDVDANANQELSASAIASVCSTESYIPSIEIEKKSDDDPFFNRHVEPYYQILFSEENQIKEKSENVHVHIALAVAGQYNLLEQQTNENYFENNIAKTTVNVNESINSFTNLFDKNTFIYDMTNPENIVNDIFDDSHYKEINKLTNNLKSQIALANIN